MATRPETKREFVTWCANDPRYFLETCTKIRLETGMRSPWRFNTVQARHHHELYDYPAEHLAVRRIRNTLILKSRQYGQSSFEIGDLFWSWTWRPGYVAKVIAYRDDTAEKLKLMANTFYNSAREYFAALGMDPDKYLPFANTNNKHELYCEATGSLLEFTSEGAKGEGRAVTVNAIYGTEYSEWKNPEDVMAGFGGSLVKDGSAIVTLDGTGKGIGNALHVEWQRAQQGESIYTPFFYGRDDYEYLPEFLEDQRRRLGKKKFAQEYPATAVEAFSKDDNAFYDAEDIEAVHRSGEYYSTIYGTDVFKTRPRVAGVDTAEGTATGNYSVISEFDAETLHEAFEPFRAKAGPRALAEEMLRRATYGPILYVVERNAIGVATIELAIELGLESLLYRHPEPKKKLHECRLGFPATGGAVAGTKPLREAHADKVLDSRECVICSDNAAKEMTEYCRNENGKTGKPSISGMFYDDEADALQMAWWGAEQALRMFYASRDEEFLVVGSMRGDGA